MRCEKCKAETVVKDSRPKDKSIRRRRECLRCGHRFFTMEVLEAKPDLKIVPKPTPKPVKRKARKPRFEDLNFDSMTDEEIEAAMEEYK
jgi:transcriptional regulator NrdR family protein